MEYVIHFNLTGVDAPILWLFYWCHSTSNAQNKSNRRISDIKRFVFTDEKDEQWLKCTKLSHLFHFFFLILYHFHPSDPVHEWDFIHNVLSSCLPNTKKWLSLMWNTIKCCSFKTCTQIAPTKRQTLAEERTSCTWMEKFLYPSTEGIERVQTDAIYIRYGLVLVNERFDGNERRCITSFDK